MPERKSLEEIISEIDSLKLTPATRHTFEPPKKLKQDASEKLAGQRSGHRTALLWLVGGLCALSFALLAFIVIFQMIMRIDHPDYEGVSDVVINILTGGVFGELIAVIAIIAKEVWKDPKR